MATRWTSKLTGQKIDETIDYVCNPNLLDNWYFANPVNQRGQTEYSGNKVYTIDRWMLSQATGTLTVDSGQITYTAGTATVQIRQYIEAQLPDGYYTLSFLLPDKSIYYLVMKKSGNSYNYLKSDGSLGVTSAGVGAQVSSNNSKDTVFVYIPAGASLSLVAAKFEFGSQQTLAHQDADGNWVLNEIPDYGEQLARCQRYYQVFDCTNAYVVIAFGHATETTVFRGLIPTLVAMRTTPAIEFTGASKSLVLHGNSSAVSASSAPYSAIKADINGAGFIMTVSSLTKKETYVLQAYGCKLELRADL